MISIVSAAFNEEKNLPSFYASTVAALKDHQDFEIIFVDDGSSDRTLEVLNQLVDKDSRCSYLSLSRNFGQQAAIKAGLDIAKGDCVIMLDCDLQHPPDLIPEMLQAWKNGHKIIISQRKAGNEPFFKKWTSRLFYRLINFLSDTRINPGTADFRLVDKQIAHILKDSEEYHLFYRGLISWLGFKPYLITYEPEERKHGSSGYSFKKMVRLSLDGITSFSTVPLRLATLVGSFISFLSFIYIAYALYTYFFTDRAVSGWTSLIITVLFIGGIQLIFLGVIGEYIGKIFQQVKKRPTYIVNERSNE